MEKRLPASPLTGATFVGLAAYGDNKDEGSTSTPAGRETIPVTDGTGEPSAEDKIVKVGMVCIDDENDQGYTHSFTKAVEEATAQLAGQGTTVEWSYKENILEDSGCEGANTELVEDGRDIVINNPYSFGSFMLKVVPGYPRIEFISCVNQVSAVDDLDNTRNVFANVYKSRYLVGVAGDMKLQQMIDEGIITTGEAVIDYVAAFPFTEMVSGYTAFCQGAESVCPSATMKVKYVNSWSDASQGTAIASALTGKDCVLISQYSDNTTPATSAQDADVFHYDYNDDMTGVAPEASLISCRTDQTPCFVYATSAVTNGESFNQDWAAGYADSSVKLTELNTATAISGTEGALKKTETDLADGLYAFASPLSGHLTQNPDDEVWSIGEGRFFPESDLNQEGGLSASQLCYIIDGTAEEQTKDQTGSKGGAGPGGPVPDSSPVTAPGAFAARDSKCGRGEHSGPTGVGKGGWAWNRSV